MVGTTSNENKGNRKVKKQKFKTSNVIIIALIVAILIAIIIPTTKNSDSADTDKSASSSVDWADDDDTTDDDSDNYDYDSPNYDNTDYDSSSSEASSSSSSEASSSAVQTAPQVEGVVEPTFVLSLDENFESKSLNSIYSAISNSVDLASLNDFIATKLTRGREVIQEEKDSSRELTNPWIASAESVAYESHDSPLKVTLSDWPKDTINAIKIQVWCTNTVASWYQQNNTVGAQSILAKPNINVFYKNTKIFEMGPAEVSPNYISLNETEEGKQIESELP